MRRRLTFCFPAPDPAIDRRCVACGGGLQVTVDDEMFCPLCGRVAAWTVSLAELAGDRPSRPAALAAPAGLRGAGHRGRPRRGRA